MAEKREAMMEQGVDGRIERSEELAREALGYWQTTLRGLFALPNATVLSLSSGVLYASAVAEQAYKRIESLTGRVSGEITRELGEVRRTNTLPEAERSKRQQASTAS
jgi:hypothetical protein